MTANGMKATAAVHRARSAAADGTMPDALTQGTGE